MPKRRKKRSVSRKQKPEITAFGITWYTRTDEGHSG